MFSCAIECLLDISKRFERNEIDRWTADYFGREIIVTPERLEHIREVHPFIAGYIYLIGETLTEPDEVRESSTTPTVHLFYRWYSDLSIGDKIVCAVVKVSPFMGKVWSSRMEKGNVNIWFDKDGDFLEVIWEVNEGYFTETDDNRVMVKLDMDGNVLGFHILGFSSMDGAPFAVPLKPVSKITS